WELGVRGGKGRRFFAFVAPNSQLPTPNSRLPGIRVGLKQVKGITRADLDSIAVARAQGPFTSLADFCARTTVTRDVVENLVLCGAFDSLEPNRRALYWELEAALAARAPVAAEEGQTNFGFRVPSGRLDFGLD